MDYNWNYKREEALFTDLDEDFGELYKFDKKPEK